MWIVEYWDGTNWQTLEAYGTKITETLNKETTAEFALPNTETNRNLATTDTEIRIHDKNNTRTFYMVITSAEFSEDYIKCKATDKGCYKLNSSTLYSGNFREGQSANDIVSDLVEGTDVTLVECPSDTLFVEFIKANRLEAVKFLSELLSSSVTAKLEATLQTDSTPLSGRPIYFYYRTSGGSEWLEVPNNPAFTDDDGKAVAYVAVEGGVSYDFKAYFPGDETYDDATATVTTTLTRTDADWWFTYDTSGNPQLHLAKKGSTKSSPSTYWVRKRKEDRWTIRNRIYVYGEDENGQPIVAVVEDSDSIAQYGVREARVRDWRLGSYAECQRYGYRLLRKYAWPTVTIPLEVDLVEALNYEVGDEVTFDDPDHDLEGTYRISRIRYYETTAVFELVQPEREIDEELEDVLRKADSIGIEVERGPLYQAELPREHFVANGDFEFDRDNDGIPDYWTPVVEMGSPTFGRTNLEHKTGGYSAFITCAGSGHKGRLDSVLFPVEGGKKYYVQCSWKGSVAGTTTANVFDVRWYDANRQEIGQSPSGQMSVTTDWQTYGYEVTAPSNARYAKVCLLNIELNGTIYFDSVTFSELRAAKPTGSVVAGVVAISAEVTPGSGWQDLYTFTVPDEEMECYCLYMQLKADTSTLSASIRIYDETTGHYYPIDDPNTDFQLMNVAFAPSGPTSSSCFCIIPRNVQNHTLRIQVRDEIGSTFTLYLTAWGHSPHYHR